MTRVLVLSGSNHGFDQSAPLIQQFLHKQQGIEAILTDDKSVLASADLNSFDACVFGTGFTRAVRLDDGALKREADLSAEQEEGLFQFVAGGKGLVGIHGTGWWIGGRAVDLIGGHANWHPPGLTFTVNIDDRAHPVTAGIDDFEVEDEIYMSAYDPAIQILASAQWSDRAHPMAWVKPYGAGRVFYTTLGHGPGTFTRPAVETLITQGVKWVAQDS